MKRFALAAAILLGLSPLASAEGLALTASVDKDQVAVGGTFTVTVRLKNEGKEPVELPPLLLDRQLASLQVQLDDGRESFFEKIHPSPYIMKSNWERKPLGPGETWQLQVDLPALAAGTFKVTAHYGRWFELFEPLYDEAKEKLAADPENKALQAKLSSVEKQRGLGELPHLMAKPVAVKINPAGSLSEVSVRMLTNLGPVRMRLFGKEAPATCLHFVKLIREGAKIRGEQRQPFYRGLTFHRVIANFMIQGGCPNGNGLGGPGYAIPAELAPKVAVEEGGTPEVDPKLKHIPGRLSMARSGHYDSAGSQFFICVGASPDLDGEYTVFGEVTRGMETVMTIGEVPTGAKDKPIDDVTIELMEVLPEAND